MPRDYRTAALTWKRRNPGWAHRMWDDHSLRALMSDCAPEWLRAYAAQPEMEARADVGRYALLDLFGGVYADIDTECRRPIASLLAGSDSRLQLTIYSNPRSDPDPFAHATNSVMASFPGHPVWSRARSGIEENAQQRWVVARTGPLMLRPILRRYAEEHPGDIRLIGYPYSITTFMLPKPYMRLLSWMRRENCLLDFNDSARRAAREKAETWSRRVLRPFRRPG